MNTWLLNGSTVVNKTAHFFSSKSLSFKTGSNDFDFGNRVTKYQKQSFAWNAICMLLEISILEFGFQNNENSSSFFVAIYMVLSNFGIRISKILKDVLR